MLKADLLINNVDTPAASGQTYARKNPMTAEVATRAAAASSADATAAADAAAAAFPAWAALGPTERRVALAQGRRRVAPRRASTDAVKRMMTRDRRTTVGALGLVST